MKDLAGTIQLSATDVASLSLCRHLVTLELDALGGTGIRPNVYSPVVRRLIKLGEDHERNYLAKLKGSGQSLEELPGRMTQEEGTARTLDAMKRGVDIIYQGFLRGPGWFGRADFLVRVATPSRLGDHSYEVVDTKLSLEAKGRALIQLCLYSQLLEEAQGILPDSMHIILGDGTEERFATRSYLAYFRRVARDVKDAVASPDAVTYPAPIEHCAICHWQPSCDKQLRDDDDLSLVAGLKSRHRELLRESKVMTMRALAALSPRRSIEDISPSSLEQIRNQARIQCDGRAAKRVLYELLDETDVNRGLLILPEPSPGDLFVDLEGDPLAMLGGLEYLIGVTEAGPVRGRYAAFWGTDRAKEKRAFEDFVRFVWDRRRKDPNLRLYHYAPYEPAAFKRLAARHNTCEAEIDELLRGRVFVDLFRVVRQGLRASVESYSLKKIEELYGFSRKASLKDAGSCLVAMATWLDRKTTDEPDDALKATIAAYNEDDCASTLALRDWLEVRRKEQETERGKSFPRPIPSELESEEQAKRIADVEALERELTQTIPEDAALRTPPQQATWLLAQLLDWHRREDKSTHWEFYRQCDLSDDELIEDSAPLGGLEYLGEVGKEKKSTLHRYRFPDQDYGIASARNLIDPATEKTAGTLHELNEHEQTITLKRGPSLADEPHPTALISRDIVDNRVLRDGLTRLGQWMAEHGIGSRRKDYRVERALLLRAPPKVPAGVRMGAASTSETTSELGKRLALAIDGTVLAVQGPPGAGKTHLGAEMIVALVRAKKRVGIVGNSHHVIAKLLKEACLAAEREHTVLHCIQKIDDDRPVHPFVTNVGTNAAVLAGIEAGAHVIAGTAWLWSREDMREAVDVLFVDEAGQISLANVLASAQVLTGTTIRGIPVKFTGEDRAQSGEVHR